jgi:hypothetical protein
MQAVSAMHESGVDPPKVASNFWTVPEGVRADRPRTPHMWHTSQSVVARVNMRATCA